MNKPKFSKPPLTAYEKEKLADKIINAAGHEEQINDNEIVKRLYIRAPISYHKQLEEIEKITGMTINAICLEILNRGIRQKLKELKDV